ncbi:MAG: metalloregulator ArsR/SmtB family transcription factor [Alphaproteobacteria bacterium]|nr:metalloregulator ArsR/SmtB family transcription factor [Alphaproteobacteria bacterium]
MSDSILEPDRCDEQLCDSSKIVSLPEDGSAEKLAELVWAIAHPMRVRIVRMLMKQESCVCGEIVDALPISQSTVSQHLKVLKESGLVRGEVEGPKVCYCIDRKTLRELKKLVSGI